MMVLESQDLSSPLRLYAAAAAANGAANSGICFQPNPILPPHPLFPHFAARFPINLAAGFAAGLPPFLNHQGSTFRFGTTANQILSSRNLDHQNVLCNNGNRSDSSPARKRQRQYSATPTSDDSASEDHSPRKGKLHCCMLAVNYLPR